MMNILKRAKANIYRYSSVVSVVLFAAFLPLLASAAGGPGGGTTIGGLLTTFSSNTFGSAVKFLIGLALIIFLWGLVVFISATDDAKRGEGKTRMLWGLVGLFVMVSVWGIVNLLVASVGLDNSTPSDLPQPPPV